jgi:hypothetical protein
MGHAGRRGFRIHTWCESLFQASINGLETESALLDDPSRPSFYFGLSPGRYGRIFFCEGTPVEGTGTIGASYLTIATTDATIIVHHDDAIVAVIGGLYGADVDTGCVFAVHTLYRQTNITVTAFNVLIDAVPGYVRGNIIVFLASQDAILTTCTAILVYDHGPAMKAFFFCFRTFRFSE